jgi:hypothetical protein
MESTPEEKTRWSCVIGAEKHRWLNFIGRYPSIFELSRAKNGKWQVRLCAHTNWKMADMCKCQSRNVKENHWIQYLIGHLRTRPDFTDTVTRFMDVYPFLCANQHVGGGVDELPPALPPRGNLVRLIRQRNDLFIYNARLLTVSLLQ